MEDEGRKDEAYHVGSYADYQNSGSRRERQEHSFHESSYANGGMETSFQRYADWTDTDCADHTINGHGFTTTAPSCEEVKGLDIRALQLELSKMRAEMERLKSRCRVLEDDAIELRSIVHDYDNIHRRSTRIFTKATTPRNFNSSTNVRRAPDKRKERALSMFSTGLRESSGPSVGGKGQDQSQNKATRAIKAPSSLMSYCVGQDRLIGQAQMHTNQQLEMAAMNDGEDRKRNLDTIRAEVQESGKRMRDQSTRRRRTITEDSPENGQVAFKVKQKPELRQGAKRANEFHVVLIEKGLPIAEPGMHQTDTNEPKDKAIATDLKVGTDQRQETA